MGAATWAGYTIVEKIDSSINALPVYGEKNHQIESFSLTNQQGYTFESSAQADKIWVVHYFFTSCPTICPKMMKNMQQLHDLVRAEEDILLLSITVDPAHDTPERMRRYLNRYNVNHNSWQLLTGPKKKLYRLARKSFLVSATDGRGDDKDFIHSENIVVIDTNQKIRAIINGTADDADEQILSVIKRLKTKS